MSSPITISGTVVQDAQMRRTRAGASVLSFEVHPPTSAPRPPAVVRVVKDYGTGESAAYAAKARAQRLRRGVRVVLSGMGLHTVRGALVLQGVDRIEEPDLVLRNVTGEVQA